jgi:hypothetical protein
VDICHLHIKGNSGLNSMTKCLNVVEFKSRNGAEGTIVFHSKLKREEEEEEGREGGKHDLSFFLLNPHLLSLESILDKSRWINIRQTKNNSFIDVIFKSAKKFCFSIFFAQFSNTWDEPKDDVSQGSH